MVYKRIIERCDGYGVIRYLAQSSPSSVLGPLDDRSHKQTSLIAPVAGNPAAWSP